MSMADVMAAIRNLEARLRELESRRHDLPPVRFGAGGGPGGSNPNLKFVIVRTQNAGDVAGTALQCQEVADNGGSYQLLDPTAILDMKAWPGCVVADYAQLAQPVGDTISSSTNVLLAVDVTGNGTYYVLQHFKDDQAPSLPDIAFTDGLEAQDVG